MRKKMIIAIPGVGMFASPRHIMNYLRNNKTQWDENGIEINYLTQCVYKRLNSCKGMPLTYQYIPVDQLDRLKSMIRSGQPLPDITGVTPLDYFNAYIVPLLTNDDPIKKSIDVAIKRNLGTEQDYLDMIKKYKQDKK